MAFRVFGVSSFLRCFSRRWMSTTTASPHAMQTMSSASVRVALVGRPNVGKSRLYNRLTAAASLRGSKMSRLGKRAGAKTRALVFETPGLTRDRREGAGCVGPLEFMAIDTPGMIHKPPKGSLEEQMCEVSWTSAMVADVIAFVYDVRVGVTDEDRILASRVRKLGIPSVAIGNKVGKVGVGISILEWQCERERDHVELERGYQLGMGAPVGVSAEHNFGMADLYDALAPLVEMKAKQPPEESNEQPPVRMAIVGRPNVGKSTLMNRVVGQDVSLMSDTPGVTRDVVRSEVVFEDRRVVVADTAGLRRVARLVGGEQAERLAVTDALEQISFADVVVLLVDAEDDLRRQDVRIAQRVLDEGRALVVVLNKWDTVREEMHKKAFRWMRRELSDRLTHGADIPLLPLSAKKGKHVRKQVLGAVLDAEQRWSLRVNTGKLNRWWQRVITHQPPPSSPGSQRRCKVQYVTQVKARPPTFAIFHRGPEPPASWLRFVSGHMGKEFGFGGVPLRLILHHRESRPGYGHQGDKTPMGAKMIRKRKTYTRA